MKHKDFVSLLDEMLVEFEPASVLRQIAESLKAEAARIRWHGEHHGGWDAAATWSARLKRCSDVVRSAAQNVDDLLAGKD